jgi:catechol 2,3-dioxygenase-like lactoylglutathione lyase family enzyme
VIIGQSPTDEGGEMLTNKGIFSSFSVNDLDTARRFYGETLGLTVTDGETGTLDIATPGGARVMVYEKGDAHQAASFTVLNLEVDDVSAAVDELKSLGVQTKIYNDPELTTDERGIASWDGPAMAWFEDPAGNVISVIQT